MEEVDYGSLLNYRQMSSAYTKFRLAFHVYFDLLWAHLSNILRHKGNDEFIQNINHSKILRLLKKGHIPLKASQSFLVKLCSLGADEFYYYSRANLVCFPAKGVLMKACNITQPRQRLYAAKPKDPERKSPVHNRGFWSQDFVDIINALPSDIPYEYCLVPEILIHPSDYFRWLLSLQGLIDFYLTPIQCLLPTRFEYPIYQSGYISLHEKSNIDLQNRDMSREKLIIAFRTYDVYEKRMFSIVEEKLRLREHDDYNAISSHAGLRVSCFWSTGYKPTFIGEHIFEHPFDPIRDNDNDQGETTTPDSQDVIIVDKVDQDDAPTWPTITLKNLFDEFGVSDSKIRELLKENNVPRTRRSNNPTVPYQYHREKARDIMIEYCRQKKAR